VLTKKIALLYTGGKDSTFAIEVLKSKGYRVTCLVTLISENAESYMLHSASIKMTKLSAKALDIPIHFGLTKGKKEEELVDMERTIAEARRIRDFDYLASGGLSSNYQKSRIEKISESIGISSIAPLWGIDQRSYVHELVAKKYKFILTSVSSAGLDEKWLGRQIDEVAIEELLGLSQKYQFNAAFEGGEAETLVLDCPLYADKRIQILESRKDWKGDRGTLIIEHAELVDKKG